VANPFTDAPEDVIEVALLRDAVDAVLGELSEREQEILRCRFGLDGSARASDARRVRERVGATGKNEA
jgi:DNA-directed RNA polymerase sigma subunit (sigma70/sigma32)